MKPIISNNSRIRPTDFLKIGDDSIIDDFCYFSTRVEIGRCSHIASGCSIAGGPDLLFRIGDYSNLSSGVKIWCASDDFVNDIVTIVPNDMVMLKTHFIKGDVIMGNYTAVGANSVIMPNNCKLQSTFASGL
jgi:acetyltransferase-like isoleucine patch superfamily enzyme